MVFGVRSDEQVSDEETGTYWSWDGVALTGALAGNSLKEIPATPPYWFAWPEFYVGTGLYEQPECSAIALGSSLRQELTV